ncbi:MAG TPA: PAS domain-containing protein, partial [Vicinamibacterales bacterium]|nr:PAS domain-containing protein [Vicinamibacterales bacterium]
MAIPNGSDLLEAVIQATPDAIFVKDLAGRYVLVNDAFARFIGKSPSDIIGRHDVELYDPETAKRFIESDAQVLSSGTAKAFEGLATGEGGATQAYLVTKGVCRDPQGQVIGIYGISHDITELKRANESLEQTRDALFRAQKMEAVGQLTGGIAHDFNNILAVILGNIDLLHVQFRGNEAAQELIETVRRATMHGKDLTGHLLAFSRRRQLNPQPVDVNVLVADIVRLLGRTLGGSIRIATNTSADTGVAIADPSALEAAVLNIALNARDAMPDGGALTIRTAREDISQEPATDDELRPGSYAVLSLEDTGTGMPADVASKAFEPFFTTKGGRGTGLGLAMVYGFAKQSGGTVTIASSPGQGTTVSIHLPLAEAGVEAEAERPAPATLRGVARTILLVEDETEVRNIVRRQLEALGHRVLVAEAATEALLLVKAGKPDVLLTDVMLASGMNGVDLAEEAAALIPDLAVVFMSGFTAGPDTQERIRATGAPFLSKPFTT